MKEVAELLLSETKEGTADAFGEQIAFYWDNVNNLVLTWMAEGNQDELRELAEAFRYVLRAAAKDPQFLSDLPTHDQLTVRLEVLIRQIAQFFRGDNLAKYMSLLSGKRREAWRDLLLGLYDYGAGDGVPVRRSQASEHSRGRLSREAAEKAVDKMTEMGLLAKTEVGPKNVQVELTWAGRRVAQTWLDWQEDDEETPDPPSLEPLRGERMTADLAAAGLPEFEYRDLQAINDLHR